jgi:hypothetical protein
MQKFVRWFCIIWVSLLVIYGFWLGLASIVLGIDGTLFADGIGPIWTLIIFGVPGGLIIIWGVEKPDKPEP